MLAFSPLFMPSSLQVIFETRWHYVLSVCFSLAMLLWHWIEHWPVGLEVHASFVKI